MQVKYLTQLDRLEAIPEAERAALKAVAERYAFRINDYYLQLIDWDDPADPIRQLVIPRPEELTEWGRLDASNEWENTPIPGVQHKYRDTVLLLCNEVCGAYCRYCFRKRLFMNDNDEVALDVTPGVEYIRAHPEVTNVLLTGGDPLLLSTRRLADILERLSAIPHVQIIRLGSKMPAFHPWRLRDDAALQEAFKALAFIRPQLYLMAHFDHPRELTQEAIAEITCFQECGVSVTNQCPLVKGVNDDPRVLRKLWRGLSFIGVPPYYLFQGRPTAGNEPYEVPIVRGYQIFEKAKRGISGLARRARFCMSHASGKIEIVGVDAAHIYLKYHRAKDPRDEGRFMVYQRDDRACWLDDLVPVAASTPHRRQVAIA